MSHFRDCHSQQGPMGFQGPQGPGIPPDQIAGMTRFAGDVGSIGSVISPTGLLLPYAFSMTNDTGTADAGTFPPPNYWAGLAQAISVPKAIKLTSLITSIGVDLRGDPTSPAINFTIGIHVTTDPLNPGISVFSQVVAFPGGSGTAFVQQLASINVNVPAGTFLMISVSPDVDISSINPDYFVVVNLI